jgi:hypothetical protein
MSISIRTFQEKMKHFETFFKVLQDKSCGEVKFEYNIVENYF